MTARVQEANAVNRADSGNVLLLAPHIDSSVVDSDYAIYRHFCKANNTFASVH